MLTSNVIMVCIAAAQPNQERQNLCAHTHSLSATRRCARRHMNDESYQGLCVGVVVYFCACCYIGAARGARKHQAIG